MTLFRNLTKLSEIYRRQDFYNLVAAGMVPGYTIDQKFGYNFVVSTTLVPVTAGGLYQTPTTGQSIEIVSDDADDTAEGDGGRNCIVYGLDENWLPASEDVPTDGLTPVAVPGSWTRVFRMACTKSGVYATQALSSHQGIISVNTAVAGVLWGKLDKQGTYGFGQSQIGFYSVAKGFTVFMLSKFVSVDANQDVKVFFFQRPGINIVAAPFAGMRLAQVESGVTMPYSYVPRSTMGVFFEYTDIGFMAIVSAGGPAEVSVNFELLIVDNKYL